MAGTRGKLRYFNNLETVSKLEKYVVLKFSFFILNLGLGFASTPLTGYGPDFMLSTS